MRRIANIATALKAEAAGLPLRIVTNAPLAGLTSDELALFTDHAIVDRRQMARSPLVTSAAVVVVDGAIIPDIEVLPVPLALILRETPTERLAAFRLPGERPWDQLILAADEMDWPLSPDVPAARRCDHVGPIYRAGTLASAAGERTSEETTLLIANGGGGADVARLSVDVNAVVSDVRRRFAKRLRVLLVRGPRAPQQGPQIVADAVIDVGPNLDLAFRDADAVISTTGYNSVLELAATTTPALLFSAGRTYDDQEARAAKWGPLIGHAHRWGNVQESADWLLATLQKGVRRAPVSLPASGGHRAAKLLLALGSSPSPADTSAVFKKPYRFGGLRAARLVDKRSRILFARGMQTIPGRRAIKHIGFARMDGPTLLEGWAASTISDPAVRQSWIARAVEPLASLHRCSRVGLRLRRHDPWRKIRPRLNATSPSSLHLGPRRRATLLSLAKRLQAMDDGFADVVVHGDFHLRQLILPTGGHGTLLVDHDDLAWGARESDIGNCVGHLVTRPDLWRRPDATGMVALIHEFQVAYRKELGIELDTRRCLHHAALTVLRRTLKLAERTVGGAIDPDTLMSLLPGLVDLLEFAPRAFPAVADELAPTVDRWTPLAPQPTWRIAP